MFEGIESFSGSYSVGVFFYLRLLLFKNRKLSRFLRTFLICFQCIDIILDILTDHNASLVSGGRIASVTSSRGPVRPVMDGEYQTKLTMDLNSPLTSSTSLAKNMTLNILPIALIIHKKMENHKVESASPRILKQRDLFSFLHSCRIELHLTHSQV